jgi:hypothetical protein
MLNFNGTTGDKDKEVYCPVLRPWGKNVIHSLWVFANTYDDSGMISVYKARLVAEGFTYVSGRYYDETYTSVACLESVQLIYAAAASLGLHLWQVGFISPFLNGDNAFEVYVEKVEAGKVSFMYIVSVETS